MRIKKLENRRKPKWTTSDLQARIKERSRARKIASWTKLEEHELKARKIRNEVSKELSARDW